MDLSQQLPESPHLNSALFLHQNHEIKAETNAKNAHWKMKFPVLRLVGDFDSYRLNNHLSDSLSHIGTHSNHHIQFVVWFQK